MISRKSQAHSDTVHAQCVSGVVFAIVFRFCVNKIVWLLFCQWLRVCVGCLCPFVGFSPPVLATSFCCKVGVCLCVALCVCLRGHEEQTRGCACPGFPMLTIVQRCNVACATVECLLECPLLAGQAFPAYRDAACQNLHRLVTAHVAANQSKGSRGIRVCVLLVARRLL